MTALLGGPGLPCSTLRLRRLEAGELAGEARERAEAHLADCARCRATLASFDEERAELERALPFERFAAGVAARLAEASRPHRRRLPRWVPLAAAAGLAVAAALPLLLRWPGSEDQVRVKGAGRAGLVVYVRQGAEVTALRADEPVPAGSALRIGLSPGGRSGAALALLDSDGPVLLYAGPARAGIVTEAFEWTGAGEGTLVLVLDDGPVDGAALVARLRSSGVGAAAPTSSSAVVLLPLRREGR